MSYPRRTLGAGTPGDLGVVLKLNLDPGRVTIHVFQRPFSASFGRTPGPLKKIERLSPLSIRQFPDPVDRSLLGGLLFNSWKTLPDAISIESISGVLLHRQSELSRLFLGADRGKTWSRIRGIELNGKQKTWEVRNNKLTGPLIEPSLGNRNYKKILIIEYETASGKFWAIAGLMHGKAISTATAMDWIPEWSNSEGLIELESLGWATVDNVLWSIPSKCIKSGGQLDSLKMAGWTLLTPENKSISKVQNWSVSLEERIDWFEVIGNATYEDKGIPLSDLLSALRANLPWIALASGDLVYLPVDLAARLDVIDAVGYGMRIQRCFAGTLGSLGLVSEDPSSSRAILDQLVVAQRSSEKIVWDGFPLRNYQTSAVAWLELACSYGIGSLLADDMGLGKTIVALAVIGRNIGNSLIIVPASLVTQWEGVSRECLPRVEVFARKVGWQESVDCPHTITIISYQFMLQNINELKEKQWNLVIFDEAQLLKNPISLSAIAARKLQARQKIALTGTPIENSVKDLWAILNLIAPNWFPDSSAFISACREALGRPETPFDLQHLLAPFLLRRGRDEVMVELPPVEINIVRCDMQQSQKVLYAQWLGAARRAFRGNDEIKRPGAVLETLLRLRQVCCDPQLLHPKGDVSEEFSSGKTEVLVGTIANIASKYKVLVFSQFASYLELISSYLSRIDLTHRLYTGHTKNRENNLTEFRSIDGPNVLLISLKAGGVGLNLTEASFVILCDPWWNPSVEIQAWSRAHRSGQTRPVEVLRFVAAGTVEERVVALQETKLSYGRLLPSLEDIRELIELD
jgi:superfamily II DNA or RNA helicase